VKGRGERNDIAWGSARGDACAGRQELVSSIDEAATGTEGVVDERAGCCATRCLPI
jgi:hypothetical protein